MQNFPHSLIIEIQRVPLAATVVRLGLHKIRLGRDLLQLGVRILEEVAGIHQQPQPRRVDGVDDAQQPLRRTGEAPVVLQRKHHAALGGLGQAFLDRVDAPLESLVQRVARQQRFLAAQLHQLVERLHRAPTAGVESDARDAHAVSQVDALLRVLDVFIAHGGIGIDEILMDRQADQVDAIGERMSFKLLQIAVVLRVHLPVENVHPLDAKPGRLVDHCLDGHFRVAEMPVRVGRDAKLDALG